MKKHFSVLYFKKSSDFCNYHHYSTNNEAEAIARALALRAKHPEYDSVYVSDNTQADRWGFGNNYFIAE